MFLVVFFGFVVGFGKVFVGIYLVDLLMVGML